MTHPPGKYGTPEAVAPPAPARATARERAQEVRQQIRAARGPEFVKEGMTHPPVQGSKRGARTLVCGAKSKAGHIENDLQRADSSQESMTHPPPDAGDLQTCLPQGPMAGPEGMTHPHVASPCSKSDAPKKASSRI